MIPEQARELSWKRVIGFRRTLMQRYYITLSLSLAMAVTCRGSTDAGDPGASAINRANPQMRAVLDQLVALDPKPIESLSPTEARRQPSASDAVVQLTQAKGVVSPERLPPVGKVETAQITGGAGQPLVLRIYSPPGDGPFPLVLYFHGGGWVIATLDTYDSSCRAICSMAKAVVVSVDYRRAPEAKFPAAPEDCYTAVQYVFDHPTQFNGKPGQVAVVGESAGGNLATVVCMMAKMRGGHMPVQQVLIYPVTNYGFDDASYRTNSKAKPLNAAMMSWFFKNYLKSSDDGENPLVSPLKATDDQLHALPPATIVTDEIDPLHDEGLAYAARLKAAGIDVASKDYTGVTHEFFGMGSVVDEAIDAEKFVAQRLSSGF